MATEYIEYKSPIEIGGVGKVVLRPKTFDTSIKYRLIVFAPGIGGRGNGSDRDLDKIFVNDEGWTMTDLEAAIKRDGRYILVAVQTKSMYEFGEIEKGRQWALNEFKDVLDTSRVYLSGLSLGGGGSNRYISENVDASDKFAAVLALCPGGNSGFIKYNGYETSAKYKGAYLLVHCVNDTTVTPQESTFPLVKKVRNINPDAPIKVILYRAGGHAAWKAYKQNPIATSSDAFDSYTYENQSFPAINDFIGNFIGFFELNQIGRAAKFLPRLSDPKPIPPVEVPIPEPPKEEEPPVVVDPIPTPEIPKPEIPKPEVPIKRKRTKVVINANKVKLKGLNDGIEYPNSIAEVYWEGLAEPTIYNKATDADGGRCSGIDILETVSPIRYTMDMRNEKNEKTTAIIIPFYKP